MRQILVLLSALVVIIKKKSLKDEFNERCGSSGAFSQVEIFSEVIGWKSIFNENTSRNLTLTNCNFTETDRTKENKKKQKKRRRELALPGTYRLSDVKSLGSNLKQLYCCWVKMNFSLRMLRFRSLHLTFLRLELSLFESNS